MDAPGHDNGRSAKRQCREYSQLFTFCGRRLIPETLTLSYNLPAHLLQKTFISALQVYVTGQNLLTFTKYSGYDPEVNAYGTNAVALGVDYGTYPQSKTVIAGLNISF